MSRFLALILTAVAIVAMPQPLQAQIVSAQPAVFQRTLANGLEVLVVEDHAAPVVQTGVWYRFGSLYETPGKTGLAHALEHMMFRGSSHISSAGLDDIIGRLGAEMNAETNYDYTHFFFVMPADKLSVALGIESDRMRAALIAPDEWRIERGAVLSELDGDASSPFFSLLSRVRAAAYPNSSAGATALGSRADVASATTADIARYYHRWYAPNNATLVIAGDVSAPQVFALVQRDFGSIPRKALPAHVAQSPVAASGKTADAQFPFPFEVLDLSYAVPGDTEPGEPAISTLSTLINNSRSPFYHSLVETNVALAVESNSDTQLKGGLFNVFIVLNPGHHADEAQAIFQNTMNQVLKNGFDPALVAAAKKVTIAQRVLDADSIGGLASIVGYTYGVVRERVIDEDTRLAALTPQSILDAARRYLSVPNVVGHLSPNSSTPAGNSQKMTANASDNFSSRVPNGRIIEPPEIAHALVVPTGARSKIAPQFFTLHNGLRVVVQTRTDAPTVSIRGIIDSAAAFAPAGKAGVARLASDVANFGTARYDFAALRAAIDDLGGQIGFGGTFSAHGFASDFEAMLGLLADGEEHPTFPQRYFEQERDQLANSVSQEQNISGQAVDRAYLTMLLASEDPALRFPTPESVRALSREDVVAYTQRYWRPDLTTVAIVGNVSAERAKAAMEATFGTWAAAGATPNTRELPLRPAHADHAYVGTESNTVFIQLGQPLVARGSSDYYALNVLTEILAGAGAFDSRLMNEMRMKRGLVYNVTSRLNSDRDRGDLTITLSAAPGNTVAAVKFVQSQLRLLQRRPVTQTELTEAKARLVSGTLLGEESPASQVESLLSLQRFDLPKDFYSTLSERYKRITAADVMRVAKKYLHPSALIQVYSGPAGPWASGGI